MRLSCYFPDKFELNSIRNMFTFTQLMSLHNIWLDYTQIPFFILFVFIFVQKMKVSFLEWLGARYKVYNFFINIIDQNYCLANLTCNICSSCSLCRLLSALTINLHNIKVSSLVFRPEPSKALQNLPTSSSN